jgi:hypothetical protein
MASAGRRLQGMVSRSWLVVPFEGHWMMAALSALEAPLTSMTLPLGPMAGSGGDDLPSLSRQ